MTVSEVRQPPDAIAAQRTLVPRRWLSLAALAYLGFVLYGSFVPLQVQPRPLGEAIETFRNAPWLELRNQHRSDWLANVLLFVPLACLWTGAVWPRRRGAQIAASLGVFVACAALAVTIEFTQVFFPARTVTPNDIVAETIGAALGIALWWGLGPLVGPSLASVPRLVGPVTLTDRALLFYLAALCLWALLPLDLSLSPLEAWRKYKAGQLVVVPLLFLRDGWSGLARIVIYGSLWIPVGVLTARLWPRVSALAAWAFGFYAAALLEGLQLFVSSAVSDVNQVAAASAGVAVGTWFVTRAEPTGSRPPTRASEPLDGAWGAPLVTHGAPVTPFLGVVVYVALLTATALDGTLRVLLRDSGFLDIVCLVTAVTAVVAARRSGRSLRPRHPVTWMALLLLGWVFASAAASYVNGGWTPDVAYRSRQFLLGVTLLLVTAAALSHASHVLLAAAGVAGAVLLFSLTHRDLMWRNQNVAAFAVLALPLVGAALPTRGWLLLRIPFAMATVLLLWVIAATRNRGAAVGVMAIAIVMAAQSRLRLLALGAALLGLGGVAGLFYGTEYGHRFADLVRRGPEFGTAQQRLDMWDAGWRMALDNPVFGVGPGNYENVMHAYAPTLQRMDPHNQFISMVSETGFPGALLYALFFGVAFVSLWRTGQRRESEAAAVARWFAGGLAAWLAVGFFLGLQTNAIAFMFAGAAAALSSAPWSQTRLRDDRAGSPQAPRTTDAPST